VTIAKRPSVLGRDGEDEEVIWVKSEPEYFCKGDWTSKPAICPSGNLQIVLRQRRHDNCPTGAADFGAVVAPCVMASVTWRA
jgi:hypothetical protein